MKNEIIVITTFDDKVIDVTNNNNDSFWNDESLLYDEKSDIQQTITWWLIHNAQRFGIRIEETGRTIVIRRLLNNEYVLSMIFLQTIIQLTFNHWVKFVDGNGGINTKARLSDTQNIDLDMASPTLLKEIEKHVTRYCQSANE